MTWAEWMAARQLLAEEHVGAGRRQATEAEDVTFARSMTNLPR